jgi:two-component system chemotaxis response regulator CheY
MAKTVVLVGHCGPDTSFLRMTVSAADKAIKVVAADDLEELNALLRRGGIDLLLLNRELGWGFDDSTGVELIRSLRPTHPNVKIMLVSNYPDAQAAAVAAGALPGFGKRELGTTRVAQLLREALAQSAPDAQPASA